jgi:predicted transcriptional regulator
MPSEGEMKTTTKAIRKTVHSHPVESRTPEARALRAARLAAKVSQGDVADALGVRVQSFSQYETGVRALSPETLKKFKAAITKAAKARRIQ